MTPPRRFIESLVLLAVCAAGLATIAAALSSATPRVPVTINVRWAAALIEADRPALESRFTLSGGRRTEGTTFRYTLTDTSYANIEALVSHPSVEDTANIDRADFRAIAIPRLLTPRSLAFAVFGAVLLVAFRRFLRIGAFWGGAAAITVAVVLATRAFPPAGQILLTRPHWTLAAAIAAAAVLPAVRLTVPLAGGVLPFMLAAPQAVFLVIVAVASSLAWVGVEPLWHDDMPVSLVEAAYEGDRVEVTRLLATGADPRTSTTVDGEERSALEAAIQSGDQVILNLVLTAAGPLGQDLRARLVDVAERARNAEALTRLGER